MDKQAVRALAVLGVVFGLVIAMVIFGKASINLQQSEYAAAMESLRGSSLGLPITIAIFVFSAFLGVPQWALITAVVVVFGPATGGLYAWLATMISASVDFWIGRWIGAERLRRYGGDLVNRIVNIVRKNGLLTSFAVRFVPTGPFVLVNMAAGVSAMTFPSFALGTGLGIIAKIAVVVLIAQGLLSGDQGRLVMAGFAALAVLLVIGMFLARRFLKSRLDLSLHDAAQK
jgi:uncharacterized membrane protein YdjX (TVP38/TMEM64 family)